MEFGSVEDLEGVDFSLPPDDSRSRLPGTRAPEFRVFAGPTGWSMKPWVGNVYPPGTKDAQHLEAFGRAFNAVELNVTYYRVPDQATILRWRDAVPAGFRFFPKFPEDISAAKNLAEKAESVRRFAERMSGLGDRLGRAFLQLPPAFPPSRTAELATLLAAVPKTFPVAVEFRSKKWFADGKLIPQAFDLLAEHGIAAVITDVAGRRDACHASLPIPAAFVRFNGNALHPTDESRIGAWADRFAAWRERGLAEVAFFLHEPDNLLAPEATNLFARAMNQRCGPVIAEWTKAGTTQMGLL